MYDLLIVNATIVDGTGKRKAFIGDVAVKGQHIVAIAPHLVGEALRTLNAEGQVLAPGFTDTHTHDDVAVVKCGTVEPKVQQGVTTLITGNCGFSMAPCLDQGDAKQLAEQAAPVLGRIDRSWNWPTMQAWLDMVKSLPLGQNVRPLLGHSTVRVAAMGLEPRPASKQEIRRMEVHVAEGMEAGAVGLSLGLIYGGAEATFDELIRLASVVQRYGGLLVPHMKNEGDGLLESIEAMLEIARRTSVALHISHLKATGPANWGKMVRALAMIEEAIEQGLDVTVDTYPYSSVGIIPTSLLPPWALKGGVDGMLNRLRDPETRALIREQLVNGIPDSPKWENILQGDRPENIDLAFVPQEELKHLQGHRLTEAAAILGLEIPEAVCYLLEKTRGDLTFVSYCLSQDDADMVIRKRFTMIGSDGLPTDAAKPHPRLYGTFPTYLRLAEGLGLSLEESIRKVTSLPAGRFGLTDRGIIQEGKVADLLIFDPGTIESRATFTKPRQFPTGISAVIVSGQPVALDGELQQARPGQLLVPKPRRKG